MTELPKKPWTLSIEETLKQLDVSAEEGLTDKEVKRRLKQFGRNTLQETKGRSGWAVLIDQFKSLIIGILAFAAVLSFAFGEWIEGIAVLIAIIVNTVIGFFSEYRAMKSMKALKEMATSDVTVRRQGRTFEIPVDRLVPGDLIILEGGDVVGADLRIIEASKLQVNESALTGESLPVSKNTETLGEDTEMADRENMLYKGTSLTRGSGKAIVVATGMQTELGNISALAEEAGMEEQTPLEKRLEKLGRQLVWVTIGVAALVAVAGFMAGREIRLMVEIAIALSVAAVPEGLPIVATVALARGMWRMAKRNALVNRLSAVETLGSTSVICTDKTGTLTENQMTASRIALKDREVTVTGEGVHTEGEIKEDNRKLDVGDEPVLKELIEVGMLCNNAAIEKDEDGRTRAVGDPMEAALLVLGAKAGMEREKLVDELEEVREEAFDPEVKMMATIHKRGEGYFYAVKGAPEAVVEVCTRVRDRGDEADLDDEGRRHWRDRADELAEEGLRMLAFASKTESSKDAEAYEDLTLLGVVGLLDPPRKDVKKAIDTCQDAGIRVVMVTGDQAVTARNIAFAVGLVEDENAPARLGKELKAPKELSDEDKKALLDTPIFARVSPEAKLNLIGLHREAGSSVAMTGDGVNDAPALEKADIGVAMGLRGTDVAKEAADMVLQDDSFATIVAAVDQGRAIFSNIRKFTVYLLSGNMGEILAVGLASIMGTPLPLLPLQILYINVVNDAFPALALGMTEGDPALMRRPPRARTESVLTRGHWSAIGSYGVLIAVSILAAFYLGTRWLGLGDAEATTLSFISLGFGRLWHVFNMRENHSRLLRNEITTNKYVWAALAFCTVLLLIAIYVPGLSDALSTVTPGVDGWLVILGTSLIPVFVGQIVKAFRKE